MHFHQLLFPSHPHPRFLPSKQDNNNKNKNKTKGKKKEWAKKHTSGGFKSAENKCDGPWLYKHDLGHLLNPVTINQAFRIHFVTFCFSFLRAYSVCYGPRLTFVSKLSTFHRPHSVIRMLRSRALFLFSFIIIIYMHIFFISELT